MKLHGDNQIASNKQFVDGNILLFVSIVEEAHVFQ